MIAMPTVASAPWAPISLLVQLTGPEISAGVAPSGIGHRVGEAAAEHEDLDLQHAVQQPQPGQEELEHPPPAGDGCHLVNRHVMRQEHAIRSSSTSRSTRHRPRA